jgi:hypothetical protein
MFYCSLFRRFSGIAIVLAGVAACGSGSSGHGNVDARLAAFRDADIYDTAGAPMATPDASIVLPECPASCDDKNSCTIDSCDPDTHLCRNDPGNDGVSCVSSDLCSLEAACKSGLCIGTQTKDCTQPPDQCHESGYCVPSTGLCTYGNSNDRTACDDQNLCTTGDQCIAGVCTGAEVQCGPGLTCDLKTGECPGFPTPIWGTAQDPSALTALNISFSDLTVSASGALYFTAGFANTLDLGDRPLSTTDTSDYDAVIARLDGSTGRAIWSKAFGDRANQFGSSITANANDVVLVSGVFAGKIDFGPAAGIDAGALSFTNSSSFSKAFFVALDGSSGKVAWALSTNIAADSSTPPLKTKVTVDPSDNNFVLCASPNTLASGLGVSHVGGKGDVLVAKLSAESGQVLWAGQYGSAADESCDAVAADGKGKVYITGYLGQGSSLDLGNQVMPIGPTGSRQRSIYVAQFNGATGAALWGKAFATRETFANKFKSNAIVTDGNTVWIGGTFSYSAVFDQYSMISGSDAMDAGGASSSSTSAFVAALDPATGTTLWAKNWGAKAEVLGLAFNASGDLIMGGDYLTGMVFETGTLGDSPSATAPFVAKLKGTTGVAQVARGYASTSTGDSSFQAVTVYRAGKTSSPDVPYALGFLGSSSAGIDLGSPVGLVTGRGTVDAGEASQNSTLFLVKFNP